MVQLPFHIWYNNICWILLQLWSTQAVVPMLIKVACLDSTSEALQLSLLQPLTNFCSTSAYLHYFHPYVQTLLNLLEVGSSSSKVQVLKVLVNLTLDSDMLPHLLCAKVSHLIIIILWLYSLRCVNFNDHDRFFLFV